MRAMVFEGVGGPLRAVECAVPRPEPGQLLVRVQACGICRTDLHVLDGEVMIADPPRILGHQIAGTVQPSRERVGVLARELGAIWVGSSDERAPEALDAAIIFAQLAVVVVDDEHAVHAVCAHDAADPLQRGRP